MEKIEYFLNKELKVNMMITGQDYKSFKKIRSQRGMPLINCAHYFSFRKAFLNVRFEE